MTVFRVEGDSATPFTEYELMLSDIGMTAADVAEKTAIESDRIEMPAGDYPFSVNDSPIHGKGSFATRPIIAGEIIGPVRIGLSRTPLGYLVNHSDRPNAHTVATEKGSGNLVAIMDIADGEEIVIDYRNAIVEARKAERFSLKSQFSNVLASVGVCESWSRLLHCIDSHANRMITRSEIAMLESELMKMPQSDHVLEHQFAEGLYIRYVEIPAGCLFTTPVHKVESVLTILKGKIIIITEDGADIMDSPCYITTKPGAKRVILALSGVMATTVHPNPDNCRDLEELESRIYAKSFDEIEVVA